MAKEPSLPVIKTLFALSGNSCAFVDPGNGKACEERLTDPSWLSVMAEICHVRGRKEGSARFDPSMRDEQRNNFDNLVLLCPSHHTLIDDLEPERFTVEVLTEMKNRAMGRSESVSSWCRDEEEADRIERLLLTKMQFAWRIEDAEIPVMQGAGTVAATFSASASGAAHSPSVQVTSDTGEVSQANRWADLRSQVNEQSSEGQRMLRFGVDRLVSDAPRWQQSTYDLLDLAIADPMQAQMFSSLGEAPADQPSNAGINQRIGSQVQFLQGLLGQLDSIELKDTWQGHSSGVAPI